MSKSKSFKKYFLVPVVISMIFSLVSFLMPGNTYASIEEEESMVGQEPQVEDSPVEPEPVQETAGEEAAAEEPIAGEDTPPEEPVAVETLADEGGDIQQAASGEEVAADGTEEELSDESPVQEEPIAEELIPLADESVIDISFYTDEDGYVPVGESVAFSTAIEGIDVAELYWTFGNGSDFLGSDPSHVYSKDGNYTVTLTAKDINGFAYVTSTTVHASDHDPTTTEWWVSAEAEAIADDFADGNTSETPVSVESVISRIVDGDTLYFLPGIYTGTYTESTDAAVSLDGIGTGTEAAPIAFIGYDGTVFDGQDLTPHAFSVTDPLSYLGFYNFTFTNYTDSAIYIENPDIEGIKIVDNTFAGNAKAIEVKIDRDLEIENNIIVDSAVGIDISAGDAVIEHNIIVDNDTAVIVEEGSENVQADYNDLYGNTTDYQGPTEPGANDVSIEPAFADKDNMDFSLPEGSPLLEQGIAAQSTTDKDDYFPGEQVIITGAGYAPGSALTLKIVRPDGIAITGITVTTDEDGN